MATAGIVHPCARQVQSDLVILAVNLWKPVGRLNHLELAVNVNLFELIDQNDCGIAKWRRVPDRHLDGKPIGWAEPGLFHYLSGFGPVLANIGTVTG